MESLRIVLDTNIIMADPLLNSRESQSFRKVVTKSKSTVLIPQVVYQEVRDNYETRVREAIKGAKALRDLLVDDAGAWLDSFSVENLVESYGEYLLGLIPEQIRLLDWPTIPHEKVIGRMLSGRRPFRNRSQGEKQGEKEKGYKDYLIWLSVLREMQSPTAPGRLIFISNNTSDFGKAGNLHDDLVRDIQDLGSGVDKLEYLDSIFTFNRRYVGQQQVSELESQWPTVREDIQSEIVAQRTALIQRLSDPALREALEPDSWGSVAYLGDPEDFEVLGTSGGGNAVDALVRWKSRVDVFGIGPAYPSTAPFYQLLRAELSATVTCDVGNHKVLQIHIEKAERL